MDKVALVLGIVNFVGLVFLLVKRYEESEVDFSQFGIEPGDSWLQYEELASAPRRGNAKNTTKKKNTVKGKDSVKSTNKSKVNSTKAKKTRTNGKKVRTTASKSSGRGVRTLRSTKR